MNSSPRNSGPTVLVVDDDQDLLNLMETMLAAAGANAVLCSKPLEALAMFETDSQQFDVVFVDIMMPRLNGNQLTSKIRESGYEGAIIAFTSSVSGQGRKTSKSVGIDHYLDKMTLSVDLVTALLGEYTPEKK